MLITSLPHLPFFWNNSTADMVTVLSSLPLYPRGDASILAADVAAVAAAVAAVAASEVAADTTLIDD